MSQNKVYAGNLSFGVNSDDLRELFSQAGNVVDAKVITDRDTGRSRGFGFVTFGSDSDAQKAVEQFNGFQHYGRALRVNLAEDNRR